MAPWAQDPPRSGECGLWCRPLGFSAADAWKVASPNTHGDHALALRGVILVAASRRFVRLMLLPIDSYFS